MNKIIVKHVSKFENSPAVRKWFRSLTEDTQKIYIWHFSAWMRWITNNSEKFKDFTPDQLIEYVQEGNIKQENDILDLILDYLLTINSRKSHKEGANKVIHSFFARNRAALPKDATLTIKGDKPKVPTTLTAEKIKIVVIKSNFLYKAVFLCMFQGLMGENEFIRWSNSGLEDLREHINEDAVKVTIQGRKGTLNEYVYYTWILGDALVALRNYMKLRDETKFAGEPYIFINARGGPLSRIALYHYWSRKTKQLGIKIKSGWEGNHVHNMRDVALTLWEDTGVPSGARASMPI